MGNPFIHAYLQSDWFGKGIFFGLFALSGISWTLLIHKGWILFQVDSLSKEFSSLLSEKEPLSLQFSRPVKTPHPFFEIYKSFKIRALSIIGRSHTFFSSQDLDLLESELYIATGAQMKKLEKHIFILSTIAALGPFVGLLGTVWGIVVSFSHMQGHGNEGMLTGLSLALSTTALGLVVAIPALIGHSYLKNAMREQRRDMEEFSHKLLSSVELYYRQGDHAAKTDPLS